MIKIDFTERTSLEWIKDNLKLSDPNLGDGVTAEPFSISYRKIEKDYEEQ